MTRAKPVEAAPTRTSAAPKHRRDPSLVGSTYGLALGTFAVGVSGHSVAGLLPQMSAYLRTSPAAVGQMVTVFALTCALAGPLLMVATGRWDRRKLLVSALLVTGLGNLVAAAAPDYLMLATGRVITALGAATATAVAVSMAAHLNSPRLRARAMSVVLVGLTIALLVGVPGASALAALVGHKVVLAVVAGVCAVAAAVIAVSAPPVGAPAQLTMRQRLAAAGERRVLAVLGAGLLAWMSCFAVYPYLATLLAHHSGANGAPLSVLLAAYGIGAAAGNLASGRAADRFGPRPPLIVATGGCALLLLAVMPSVANPVSAMITLAMWGFGSWSINPALNAWLVQLDEQRSALLLALNASSIYLGMGLGGLLGGAVLSLGGVPAVTPVAAGVAATACALLAVTAPVAPQWRGVQLPPERPQIPVSAQLTMRLR